MIKGSCSGNGPSGPGSQYPGAMPCGKKMPTNRGLGDAASAAASGTDAGSIASSSGSVSVHPAPFRNVRRGMCRLVMNMELFRSSASVPIRVVDLAGNGLSHFHVQLERLARDDAHHVRREAVLIPYGV